MLEKSTGFYPYFNLAGKYMVITGAEVGIKCAKLYI